MDFNKKRFLAGMILIALVIIIMFGLINNLNIEPEQDDEFIWTITFAYSGKITDSTVRPNPYMADTQPGYFFEIDNSTVIRVPNDSYHRWGTGNDFRYFNTEIQNTTWEALVSGEWLPEDLEGAKPNYDIDPIPWEWILG